MRSVEKVEANKQKVDADLRKLVSNARAILTYQVGLPHGCVRMRKILFWLKPHCALSYPVFDEYLEATRELPIGSERLHWNKEALKERDIELETINQRFRDAIVTACHDIIERHAKEEVAK